MSSFFTLPVNGGVTVPGGDAALLHAVLPQAVRHAGRHRGHVPDVDDSCDSLYDSLVTAYLM